MRSIIYCALPVASLRSGFSSVRTGSGIQGFEGQRKEVAGSTGRASRNLVALIRRSGESEGIVSSAKRVMITMTFALGVMLFGAVAWACVPQEGAGTVTNVDTDSDYHGSTTDLVVGDGVDATQHWQSWCEDHPSSAVWAAPGEELQFNIEPADPSESDTVGCPAPTNGSTVGTSSQEVWLVTGNAYTWNGEYWDFRAGTQNGCYAPNQSSQQIGSIDIDSNGYSQASDNTETLPSSLSTNTGTRTVGDDASLLCVGDDEGSDTTALFFPLVLTTSSGSSSASSVTL